MTWKLGALVCSLSYGLQMIVIKLLSRRGFRTVKILWYLMAGSVPVLWFFYHWSSPHAFQASFPLVLLAAVGGNLLGFYAFVKAIEQSDVSLVSPLLSLSPLFMLLTSWVMLSEFPDFQGLLGILAITVGTYQLAKSPDMGGLEPLQRLWEDIGVRWALLASFVWSITANIDKLAVMRATPIGYSFAFHVAFTLVFLPVYLYFTTRNDRGRSIPFGGVAIPIIVGLLGAGVLQATMSGSQMYAIMETDVAYIIALKRAGMLVSVLGGGLFLGEANLRQRFLASVIVFLGLVGIIFR
jgi:drug/metabolite transporter (DMT)-like permease